MNTIVAVGKNYEIGRNGRLLFKIPEDMAYFRAMTTGRTVIMGRKTLESLPGGRPLKNRRNIVFSRNSAYAPEGAEVVHSVDVLRRFDGLDEAFVIGGEEIYSLLLPYCERAYVTAVEAEREADSYFPNLGEMEQWELESASPWYEQDGQEGLRYQFRVYINRSVMPLR